VSDDRMSRSGHTRRYGDAADLVVPGARRGPVLRRRSSVACAPWRSNPHRVGDDEAGARPERGRAHRGSGPRGGSSSSDFAAGDRGAGLSAPGATVWRGNPKILSRSRRTAGLAREVRPGLRELRARGSTRSAAWSFATPTRNPRRSGGRASGSADVFVGWDLSRPSRGGKPLAPARSGPAVEPVPSPPHATSAERALSRAWSRLDFGDVHDRQWMSLHDPCPFPSPLRAKDVLRAAAGGPPTFSGTEGVDASPIARWPDRGAIMTLVVWGRDVYHLRRDPELPLSGDGAGLPRERRGRSRRTSTARVPEARAARDGGAARRSPGAAGNRLEALRGDRGQHSIRINDPVAGLVVCRAAARSRSRSWTTVRRRDVTKQTGSDWPPVPPREVTRRSSSSRSGSASTAWRRTPAWPPRRITRSCTASGPSPPTRACAWPSVRTSAEFWMNLQALYDSSVRGTGWGGDRGAVAPLAR